MFQTFNFTAGGRQINAKGRFFRYESGSASGSDNTIRLRADGQDLGVFQPGDSIELDEPVLTWEIVPTVQQCIGKVRVGMGRISSTALSGLVYVIDQSLSKSQVGRQFYGTVARGADAANVAYTGVSANNSSVAVRAIVVQSSVAGFVRIGYGTAGGTSQATAAAFPNKFAGQPASTCRAWSGVAATINPTAAELPGEQFVATYSLQANTPYVINLPEPMILSGTSVLYVNGGAINRDISTTFALEEFTP